MHNLFLKSINWSFENLNLRISSCFLATAHLNIYQNLSNEILSESNEGLTATIDGSSLGFLKAENVSHILITKSNITGRNTEGSSSFFVLHKSNMTIFNSVFTKNSIKFNSTKPTLLKASGNSSIIFVNSNVSRNTGYKNIIQVFKVPYVLSIQISATIEFLMTVSSVLLFVLLTVLCLS